MMSNRAFNRTLIGLTTAVFVWSVAAWTGTAAENFLGTQGDVWGTRKDMALAGIGAIAALLTLGRIHDRALWKLNK